MADEETTYKYASAQAAATVEVDPKTAEMVTGISWDESDKSHHDGTEYHFPPETGLPYLRTEWYPRTDGESWGIGFLFMATATPATGGGPSDYSFAEAEDHPDNEQHYRDVLYEPWNALFPDKASVELEDGTTVTIDDAVAEMARRYRAWLANIHPSQLQQKLDAMEQIRAEIELSVQAHNDLAAEVVAEDPKQTPDTLVLDVGATPQAAPAVVAEG